MTNWLVTLINTDTPFDKKQVIVHAETVIEALDEKNHGQDGYFARSACFHSTVDPSDYYHHNQALVEQECGYGWGPIV